MKILLDTHIALWAITDDHKLPQAARDFILDPDNEVIVSAASVWEISIKHSLGRGNMPISGEEALMYFHDAGYRIISVTAEHAAFLEKLPQIHSDPFDRILISQAKCEPLMFLTHDILLAEYGELVTVI